MRGYIIKKQETSSFSPALVKILNGNFMLPVLVACSAHRHARGDFRFVFRRDARTRARQVCVHRDTVTHCGGRRRRKRVQSIRELPFFVRWCAPRSFHALHNVAAGSSRPMNYVLRSYIGWHVLHHDYGIINLSVNNENRADLRVFK